MPDEVPHLPKATAFAHQLLEAFLNPGDFAVDATTGNGHDTLFLAERVGKEGRVIGLDLQEDAISATAIRCKGHDQVELFQADHEHIDEFIDSSPKVIVFNLGYLPSGDKSVITRPESTVPALDAASRLLQPGGLLSVAVYHGHPGGKTEAKAVSTWAKGLPEELFLVARYSFLNQPKNPPYLLAIEKRKHASTA